MPIHTCQRCGREFATAHVLGLHIERCVKGKRGKPGACPAFTLLRHRLCQPPGDNGGAGPHISNLYLPDRITLAFANTHHIIAICQAIQQPRHTGGAVGRVVHIIMIRPSRPPERPPRRQDSQPRAPPGYDHRLRPD